MERVDSPRSTGLFGPLELASHGFRQLLFQPRGQPVLQRRLLAWAWKQKSQPSAAFLVIPTNFGPELERIVLAWQSKLHFHFRPRLQGDTLFTATPPSLRFASSQFIPFPSPSSTMAGTARG